MMAGPRTTRLLGLFQLRLARAQALDGGAPALAFQAALARAERRPGRAAWDRGDGCALRELDKPVEGVLAIALLGAETLRGDNEHAVAGKAVTGEILHALPDRLGQRGRMPHVEAKLHRARKLVDVLPARARGADKSLLDLVVIDRDRV